MASQQLPFSSGQWDSEIYGISGSEWRPNGMVRTAAEVGGEKMGGGGHGEAAASSQLRDNNCGTQLAP